MPSDNENSSLKQRWRKTIKNTYLSFRHHSICIASRPSLRSHSANFEIGKNNTSYIVSMVSISVWLVLHSVISTSRSGAAVRCEMLTRGTIAARYRSTNTYIYRSTINFQSLRTSLFRAGLRDPVVIFGIL